MQTYKLKNLPFFVEARLAAEGKCDCPHCKNKEKQIKDASNNWFKGSRDRGLR